MYLCLHTERELIVSGSVNYFRIKARKSVSDACPNLSVSPHPPAGLLNPSVFPPLHNGATDPPHTRLL